MSAKDSLPRNPLPPYLSQNKHSCSFCLSVVPVDTDVVAAWNLRLGIKIRNKGKWLRSWNLSYYFIPCSKLPCKDREVLLCLLLFFLLLLSIQAQNAPWRCSQGVSHLFFAPQTSACPCISECRSPYCHSVSSLSSHRSNFSQG